MTENKLTKYLIATKSAKTTIQLSRTQKLIRKLKYHCKRRKHKY